MENSTNLFNKRKLLHDNAIKLARETKQKLYEQYPDLNKIEEQITNISFELLKEKLAQNTSQITEKNKELELLQKERSCLISKYKIDENIFKPKFKCTICEDLGYISKNGITEICSCAKQELYDMELNSSNISNLSENNFQNFNINYYSNNVDQEKYKKNISPQENMKNILKIVHNFIDNFEDINQKNLMFSGDTGLGKTFLSSCIAHEMIKKNKTVVYQTAPLLFDEIINFKFGKTKYDIISEINSADLLIIDDLGTEFQSQIISTEIFNLINSRLLNQDSKIKKTIISTNYSLSTFHNKYEERITSRIIGDYDICQFFGDDIRLIKKLKSNKNT